MTVPLYWWKLKWNFGDQLAPIVVRHLTGREVRYSESPGKLLATGSILHMARSGDHVWGSGLRRECELTRKLFVHAVRGPMTRSFLLKNGIECPAIYGDPALLMPDIYQPVLEKAAQVAVLPHPTDRILQWMARQAKLPVILPTEPPLVVIDRILQSELLVTSSLYGLIVAEAYGVPVVLLRQRRQSWEPHFEFVDYFASTGREDITVWDTTIYAAINRIADLPRPVPIDGDKLVAAFPKGHCHDPL